MASIVVTWALPEVTAQQTAIDRVLVELSAAPEELGWTEHKVVSADGRQTVTLADAAVGTHYVRLTVIDDQGRRSTPVDLSATVDSEGPSPVVDAAIVVQV